MRQGQRGQQRRGNGQRARMPDAPVNSWRMIFDPAVVSKFADCGIFMLDAGDVFVPYGDRGMVVLFAALGPDEGKEKCHRIATEIIRRLLGEDAVPAAARIG